MNGGILPLLLLGATFGLSLALAPLRTAAIALASMAAAALLLLFVPLSSRLSDTVFTGLWLSMIATAALAFVPRDVADRLMIPAGLNAGAWAGALASLADQRAGLVPALALGLLFLPARWFPLRGYAIVIKVVTSWMIAIASLSMFVSLVPTPGYKPDHME